MWLTSSRIGVVIQSSIAVPIVFIMILFSWFGIQRFLGSRKESRLIRDQRSIVERWLRDPRVHSFQIGPTLGDFGRLLIRLDVDDKATFEMIERELDGALQPRLLPKWDITIRNGEKFVIDNGYGYHAEGIAMALEGPAAVFELIFKVGIS